MTKLEKQILADYESEQIHLTDDSLAFLVMVRKKAAAVMGSSRSKAKAIAARKNGKLGGRPKENNDAGNQAGISVD